MADQPADSNSGNSSAPVSQVPVGGQAPVHSTFWNKHAGKILGTIVALTFAAVAYFGIKSFQGESEYLRSQISYQQTELAAGREQCQSNLDNMLSTLEGRPINVTCVSDCCDNIPTSEVIYLNMPTATPIPFDDLEARLYCLDKNTIVEGTPMPGLWTEPGLYTKSIVREITDITEKQNIINDYFTLGKKQPEIEQCGECLLKIEYDWDVVGDHLYEVQVRYGNCGVTPQPSRTPSPTGTLPYNPSKTPTPTPTLVTPTTTPVHEESTPTYVTPFDDDTPTPEPTTTPVHGD